MLTINKLSYNGQTALSKKFTRPSILLYSISKYTSNRFCEGYEAFNEIFVSMTKNHNKNCTLLLTWMKSLKTMGLQRLMASIVSI